MIQKLIRESINRLMKVRNSRKFKSYLGIQLAGITALYGVVAMPTHAFDYNVLTTQYVDGATFVPVTTETTYQFPVEKTLGISQYFGRFHPGLDVRSPRGTKVFPIASGTVAEVVSQTFGYGHYIRLIHEGNIVSLYAHLDKINVVVGQKVTKETTLGTIGMTGWTTGPHLHFEMSQNGKAINPLAAFSVK